MKIVFEKAVDQQTKAHGQTSEGVPGIFQNLAANFFKGLTQNSTQKLKVEIQFYVDSEKFMTRY